MIFVSSLFTRVFRWQVPSYIFLISIALLLFLLVKNYKEKYADEIKIGNLSMAPVQNHESTEVFRLHDSKLTSPLLLTEHNEISAAMAPISQKLSEMVNDNISRGNLESASIYLRKMNEASSVSINGNEEYNPGSMMKIPIMMTCLKLSMADPLLMNKKIQFVSHNINLSTEAGAQDILVPGKSYTVKELIEYMIIDSDNESMGLLFTLLGQDKIDKIFTDLNIHIPERTADAFNMNVKSFSRFLSVLYNATYLDVKNSEWALTMLSKVKYNKGITRTLPKQITVAHKYGVEFNGNTKFLSESAIVYNNSDPYMIVVMTKGTDYNKQSEFISQLSDVVFNKMNN